MLTEQFCWLGVLAVFATRLVTGDVLIYERKTHRQIEVEFRDRVAEFGSDIPEMGIRAYVVYANPPNACSPLAPPPNITNFANHWAVLIQRYDCSFEKKIREAQAANYDVAIVHNVNSSELEIMKADNPVGIRIPSIFIGYTSGLIIKENYQYDKGYYVIIDDDNSAFDFGTHLLLPFAIVLAICFLTMVVFAVMKCIKDRRRNRRHRLPNSSLKKIPTTKYRKNDPYETCAICLEDFIEGEKLRVLPCSHAYHCKCIDPWLTRNKRVCPMCKRRVFAEDERVPSDSESGSDDDGDIRPLLQGSTNTTQGGTFGPVSAAMRARLLNHYITSLMTQVSADGHSAEGSSYGSNPGPSQVSPHTSPIDPDDLVFHQNPFYETEEEQPQPNATYEEGEEHPNPFELDSDTEELERRSEELGRRIMEMEEDPRFSKLPPGLKFHTTPRR